MGRICAVSGCSSRSQPNQNERKLLGLRQLRLFQAPKCKAKRQQWANLLEIVLRPIDYVCELHFCGDNVQRAEVFFIDGQTHILPRERITLKKDAVPRNQVFSDTPMIVDENQMDVENDVGQFTQADVHEANVVQTDPQNNVQPDERNVVTISGLETTSSEVPLPVQAEGDEGNVIQNDLQDDIQPDERNVLTIPGLESILSKGPVPVNWSWSISPVSDAQIVFVQIDPVTLKIRTYFYFYNDLSVTIRTSDGIGELKLDRQITTISELEDLIHTTEKAKLCTGSGVQTESRSKNCTVIVEERYQRFKTPRCIHCREIRRLRLKNVSRTARNTPSRKSMNNIDNINGYWRRFFGMMRSACGSNDHPDPAMFSQVFRLLCTYSLVKPPRGCNVSGPELLESLMLTRKPLTAANEPRKRWLEKIDALIETRDFEESEEPGVDGTRCHSSNTHLFDHTYNVRDTSYEVQTYLAGYIVRKMRNVKCKTCLTSLRRGENENHEARESMIELMTHGRLKFPSESLYSLTKILECAVLDVVGKNCLNLDTITVILEKVSEFQHLPMIGCKDHTSEMTKKIIDFYLVMRAYFLTKSYNIYNNNNQEKTRMHRKHAKL